MDGVVLEWREKPGINDFGAEECWLVEYDKANVRRVIGGPYPTQEYAEQAYEVFCRMVLWGEI
jgi:hypothetical protein